MKKVLKWIGFVLGGLLGLLLLAALGLYAKSSITIMRGAPASIDRPADVETIRPWPGLDPDAPRDKQREHHPLCYPRSQSTSG